MATLVAPDNHSPVEDAKALHKAFKGWGTDENAIISILGHRSAAQRQQIRLAYQNLYQKDLIKQLESELSGDFERAVVLWAYDPVERDVKLIKDALKNKKNSVKHLQTVIVEIACAWSPHHLIAVRKAYCSLFDCSLEEDIASIFPLSQRKLLLGLVSTYRYDKEKVDMDVAKTEADTLHEAIKAKLLDHDDVVHILGTRSAYQLRACFECYKQSYGNPIDQDIKEGRGNGDLRSLLKMVIWCIGSPEIYFAKVIRSSIVGLGTDEDLLNRVIVSRAEVDMKKIKEEYVNLYKNSVEEDVIEDTSGNYKDFLLTLIGAKL